MITLKQMKRFVSLVKRARPETLVVSNGAMMARVGKSGWVRFLGEVEQDDGCWSFPSVIQVMKTSMERVDLERATVFDPEAPLNLALEHLTKTPTSDLAWVLQACSDDEGRPHINHLSLDAEYLAGTDGHRLHVVPATSPTDILIPRWVAEVLIAAKGERIEWYLEAPLGEYTAVGVSGSILVQFPLNDFRFPPFRAVMEPLKGAHDVLVKGLLTELKRFPKAYDAVRLIAGSDQLDIVFYGDGIPALNTHIPSGGDAVDQRINLNRKYLTEAVSDDCTLTWVDADHGLTVKSGERVAVVMPVRE